LVDFVEIVFVAILVMVLVGERDHHELMLSKVAADTEAELRLAVSLLVALPLAGGGGSGGAFCAGGVGADAAALGWGGVGAVWDGVAGSDAVALGVGAAWVGLEPPLGTCVSR
jgi:hypothetical protein